MIEPIMAEKAARMVVTMTQMVLCGMAFSWFLQLAMRDIRYWLKCGNLFDDMKLLRQEMEYRRRNRE